MYFLVHGIMLPKARNDLCCGTEFNADDSFLGNNLIVLDLFVVQIGAAEVQRSCEIGSACFRSDHNSASPR